MNKAFIMKRVQKLRLQRNWSIEELMKRMGYKSELFDFLLNASMYFPLDLVLEFCKVFDVTLSQFFEQGNDIVLHFEKCDSNLCRKYKRSSPERKAKLTDALHSVLRSFK